MLRSDFVSNSSSSSFVVTKCQDENVLKRLNEKFIHLIKKIPGYIGFKSKENHFSDELINKLKQDSIFKFDTWYSQGYYDYIYVNDVDNLNKDHLDKIKDILSESQCMYCNSNTEDFGEYASIMTQIATLLELMFLFHCEGDDHLNYQSIFQLIEKLTTEVV